MARNKVQDALRQRKRSEAEAAMANGPPEEGAYQCFFNRDDLPSPMEGGTLCDFPLAQLSGFPDHEEHFPLYTGARLEDMVESIKRHGVQSPILVWKTAEGTYIIISGHNRVSIKDCWIDYNPGRYPDRLNSGNRGRPVLRDELPAAVPRGYAVFSESPLHCGPLQYAQAPGAPHGSPDF